MPYRSTDRDEKSFDLGRAVRTRDARLARRTVTLSPNRWFTTWCHVSIASIALTAGGVLHWVFHN